MTALNTLIMMSKAATAIGPAFEMAGQAIKNTISAVWNWFKSTFLDPIIEGAKKIGNALSAAFDALTDPVGTASDLVSGFFGKHIDQAKILEVAVLKAFDKEWDQMLHLDEQPEWITPDLWQKLQEESSVMAAQDWDGMLNLQDGKPDWMTNELWEELKDKGRDAAEQEWYSYFTPDAEKPDWMTEETWNNLQKVSAGAANQDWDTFLHRKGPKPDWMDDETWENLNTKIATEGEDGVKAIEDAWDGLVTDSDEPEWSKDEFWENVSGEIEDQIDEAFDHIRSEARKLADDLVGYFTKPYDMLIDMGKSIAEKTGVDVTGGYKGPSGGAPGMSFSRGGIATGPATGYAATLHGTEAIVPLSGGRGIPVEMKGGGGSTFNINVNASGITDRTDKRQLAREIGNMIQQEMSRSIGGTTMRGRYG